MRGRKSGKKLNQAYLTGPSSKGHALVIGRTESHYMSMSVCKFLLSGNKSRVIGVAGPPEGEGESNEGGRQERTE